MAIGHDAMTAIRNRNVVSMTSHRLIPSTPTRYFRPMDATHVASSTNWSPGRARSNPATIASETANVASVVTSATTRAWPSRSDRPATSRATNPTRGRKIV